VVSVGAALLAEAAPVVAASTGDGEARTE